MVISQDKQLSHPTLSGLDSLNADLEVLSTEVDRVYSSLGIKADTLGLTLDAIRREILKCVIHAKEIEDERESGMGLDFVSDEEAALIVDVADARKLVGEPYLAAYSLEVKSNRILRAVRESISGSALNASVNLHARVSDNRKAFHAMFWSLPDIGMTFGQWDEMPEAMRKKLRPAGRPSMPLECRFLQNETEMAQLMVQLVDTSDGELTTVKQAIEGIELSKRGRPSVSPLSKLDRGLTNARKDLEALIASPIEAVPEREKGTPGRMPATHSEKMEKMLNKIHDLELMITEAEIGLSGVEVPRRKLEKLRARHREMVLMESDSTGSEQARLLFETLKNEQEQVRIVGMIYELDPTAKETPTHQVNPKTTRDRINRLRLSGRLRESESEILSAIEESLRNTKVMRAR
jgi:hypothetical protein